MFSTHLIHIHEKKILKWKFSEIEPQKWEKFSFDVCPLNEFFKLHTIMAPNLNSIAILEWKYLKVYMSWGKCIVYQLFMRL